MQRITATHNYCFFQITTAPSGLLMTVGSLPFHLLSCMIILFGKTSSFVVVLPYFSQVLFVITPQTMALAKLYK